MDRATKTKCCGAPVKGGACPDKDDDTRNLGCCGEKSGEHYHTCTKCNLGACVEIILSDGKKSVPKAKAPEAKAPEAVKK